MRIIIYALQAVDLVTIAQRRQKNSTVRNSKRGLTRSTTSLETRRSGLRDLTSRSASRDRIETKSKGTRSENVGRKKIAGTIGGERGPIITNRKSTVKRYAKYLSTLFSMNLPTFLWIGNHNYEISIRSYRSIKFSQ